MAEKGCPCPLVNLRTSVGWGDSPPDAPAFHASLVGSISPKALWGCGSLQREGKLGPIMAEPQVQEGPLGKGCGPRPSPWPPVLAVGPEQVSSPLASVSSCVQGRGSGSMSPQVLSRASPSQATELQGALLPDEGPAPPIS